MRELLYAKEIPALLERLEEAWKEATDKREKDGLKELLGYYTENRDALSGYYDRRAEIPPTSQPGVVHHARLGSMESNTLPTIPTHIPHKRF